MRQARNVNQAFLSKLGWNMIHRRDDLWVQVLRNRYKCVLDLIPHMQANANSSFTWKSICLAWPIVLENLGWCLGNGKSISF